MKKASTGRTLRKIRFCPKIGIMGTKWFFFFRKNFSWFNFGNNVEWNMILPFIFHCKPFIYFSLFLKLCGKMLLANQISGFLNLKISKTIGGIKWVFLHAALYLIKVISWSYKFRWVWSGSGMPKCRENWE